MKRIAPSMLAVVLGTILGGCALNVDSMVPKVTLPPATTNLNTFMAEKDAATCAPAGFTAAQLASQASPFGILSVPPKVEGAENLAFGLFEKAELQKIADAQPQPTPVVSAEAIRSPVTAMATRIIKARFFAAVKESTERQSAALSQYEVSVKAQAQTQLTAAVLSNISVLKTQLESQAKTASDALARLPKISVDATDFSDFHKTLISGQIAAAGEWRAVFYESKYANGEYVNRFGTKLAKPDVAKSLGTSTIVSGLLVFWESIADQIFENTHAWKKPAAAAGIAAAAGEAYYPGASTAKPTFVEYFEFKEGQKPAGTPPSPPVVKDMIADADAFTKDGMTLLKAEAITYLSSKAGTWAGDRSSVVVGFFGGGNLGLPVALGKFSIGDNETLKKMIEGTVGYIAQRATFEVAYRNLVGFRYCPTKIKTVPQLIGDWLIQHAE